MTTFTPRIVELTEYQTRTFDEGELTEAVDKELHASYGKQISVEPPSFLNNQSWQLTSQGWVGYIPLTDSFHLSLVPKVSIVNLASKVSGASVPTVRVTRLAWLPGAQVVIRAVSSGHIDNPNLLFVEFETNFVAVKVHVVSDLEVPLNP